MCFGDKFHAVEIIKNDGEDIMCLDHHDEVWHLLGHFGYEYVYPCDRHGWIKVEDGLP